MTKEIIALYHKAFSSFFLPLLLHLSATALGWLMQLVSENAGSSRVGQHWSYRLSEPRRTYSMTINQGAFI